MFKVLFLNEWGDSPQQFLERVRKQTPEKDSWKEMSLITNPREADVVIISDGLNVDLEYFNIIKNKKIFYFQREAEHVRPKNEFLLNLAKKSFTYDNNPTFCVWLIEKTYQQLKETNYSSINKKNDLICISSNKSFTYGQKKRLEFLKSLEDEGSLVIDFYGRQKIFNNHKGTLPPSHDDRCQYKLSEYHKSLSFENGSRKNFFTRIMEPQLCWTLPMYWGCPNMNDWYPEKSYRWIDIEDDVTKETIQKINEPVQKEEIEAIEEARNLILDKYNFWPYVYERLIKEI